MVTPRVAGLVLYALTRSAAVAIHPPASVSSLSPSSQPQASHLQTSASQARASVRSWSLDDNSTADGVLVPYECLLAAAIGSGAAGIAVPLLLGALGFGTVGVLEGSLAAAWQSSLGEAGIEAGSLFAKMQSVAMGGLSVTDGVVVVGTTAGVLTTFCSAADALLDEGGKLLVQGADAVSKLGQRVGGATVDMATLLADVTKQLVGAALNSSAVGSLRSAAANAAGAARAEAEKLEPYVAKAAAAVKNKTEELEPAITNATASVKQDAEGVVSSVTSAVSGLFSGGAAQRSLGSGTSWTRTLVTVGSALAPMICFLRVGPGVDVVGG